MYKWKDNKCVHLLSSLHSPKDTGNVNRKSKYGNQKLVFCPKVLIDYNKNMNFVDNFDRLNSDYKMCTIVTIFAWQQKYEMVFTINF